MKFKNWIVIIGGVLLFAFIILMTILCYRIFEKNSQNDMINSGVLEIVLTDNMAYQNNQGLTPVSDAEGTKQSPYKFTITNNVNFDTTYKVVFKEDQKNTLKRKQLRYELKVNGKVVALDYVSKIKDDILEIRTLKKEKKNTYELRIWVTDEAKNSDWENKSFVYSVEIIPMTKEDLK